MARSICKLASPFREGKVAQREHISAIKGQRERLFTEMKTLAAIVEEELYMQTPRNKMAKPWSAIAILKALQVKITLLQL